MSAETDTHQNEEHRTGNQEDEEADTLPEIRQHERKLSQQPNIAHCKSFHCFQYNETVYKGHLHHKTIFKDNYQKMHRVNVPVSVLLWSKT